MFGVIKKIFRKSSPGEAPAISSPPSPTVEDEKNPFAFQGEPNPAISAAPPEPTDPTDCLAISYNAILRQLPRELYGKNTPGAGQIFSVAKSRVIEQLTQGAVKVPFGELRRAAPLGTFVSNSTHDGKLVDLPLKEILGQLESDAFVRRPQQRLEIPEDVADLFGSKGERLAPLRVVEKDNPLKPAAPNFASSAAKSAVAAKPAAVPTASRISPSVPPAVPGPKIPAKPGFSQSSAPLPPPPAAAPKSSTAIPGSKPASLPKPSAIPFSKPAPPSQPAIAEGNQLIVPLKDIAQGWPEAVRNEIAELDLVDATCAFPLSEIGQALKQGVIHYSWQQIRTFIKSTSPLAPSVHGGTILPLPLQIIAPLYMARGGIEQEQPKIPFAKDIPDVFVKAQPKGVPKPAAAAPSPTQASPSVPLEAPISLPPPIAAKPATATAPAIGEKGTLRISLSEVSTNWPETVRNEITKFRLVDATLDLPLDVIETGLKAGKVNHEWRQICEWLNPCPPEALSSPQAETRLELPLNVLAPLFLHRRPAQRRKSVAPIDVPDLFSVSGEQLATDVPEQSAPEVPPPAPKIAPPKLAENLAELFGEPDKKNWTPNEIVHKTSLLPDVAGALIALQDGLLVASCMPPPWKTETIAAFLPQIFGRMKQYAKELKMGELTSVSFAVEQGTLQIFNAGIIYFAALGRSNAPLPSEHLSLIARELSRHTK
jgi:predicted regulator of Ras-like GTPase activity (Roadblock/LC7/MglB family)